MRAVSRISHWFAFAGLVTASGLIGWVARSTSADNVPRESVTPVQEVSGRLVRRPPAHQILALAQAPAEPLTIKPVSVESDPPTPTATPAALVPPPTQLGIEQPSPAVPQELPSPGPGPQPLSTTPIGAIVPLPEAAASLNPATAADTEDPEKAVRSFVEQNQKVAETQLKNLRDEEAKLRARLQKVEAGIKRWEALVKALKVSKNGSVASGAPRSSVVSEPGPDTIEVLDAIPRHKIGPPSATPK
jgi:hypothetical protein